MRLGTLTLSATLSAILLSGCSFIGGQPSGYTNPYAQQKAAHHGQYGQQMGTQNCQIATPQQPIPRGCRPEQVTIGTAGYGARGVQGGFPQQPTFGQPQYTDGGYGSAVGQKQAMTHHARGPRKTKPKLRGSLSLGAERSIGGELFAPSVNGFPGYNPQAFNEGFGEGSQAGGSTTTTTFLANDRIDSTMLNPTTVRVPGFESVSAPAISFDDVWSAPISLKGGLEYIINDNTTVFASGGYTYSEGNEGGGGTVNATIYREDVTQNWTPTLDGNGDEIPGSYTPNGAPMVGYQFQPNQKIASFSYDFSDLERFDLEIGARRYLNPLVKSEGFRTVTPFVGASVGVSHVNAVEYKQSQTQTFYQRAFDGESADLTYSVPTPDTTTRLYDAAWLPQGQLNVGAEWQLTPGFALAAETGVRLEGARNYSDTTNTAGDIIEGGKGDLNISIPLTLRGSINF